MNRATKVKQTNGVTFCSVGEYKNCENVMFNNCHVFVTDEDNNVSGIPMHMVESIDGVKLSLTGE